MKIVVVSQARSGSTRLPGKVLKSLGSKSLLETHIQRIIKSKMLSDFVLATTVEESDNQIEELGLKLNVKVSRGSVDDVLDRFYQAIKDLGADFVVRLTSDCPLIDPELIDEVVEKAIEKNLDYYSNTLVEQYPDGQDIEVIRFSALEDAWHNANLKSEREHVTPYIINNSDYRGGSLFKSANHFLDEEYGHVRMTVDEQSDLDVVRLMVKGLGYDRGWREYADYYLSDSGIRSINESIIRNEGYIKSIREDQMSRYAKSEELLNRAEKSVPLGSQTFSKSKTQFPLGVSPYFATHAKGAYLWDVDGNRYADFVNSLAAITLGYGDRDVNDAVAEQLEHGTIFSLASELEITVSEKIIEMVPSAEMVRFGKNGSDATSGAIRLARAYTKRDYVLVCGYHGWQDWYIGVTTFDNGVPGGIKELSKTFTYNDIDSLISLFEEYKNQVAAVIMEPVNFFEPKDNFLEKVKEVTHQNGAVLIFDETVTGFRFSEGGAQEFLGVTPDLSTFGKGLANGFPLSAIVGKTEIMKLMEEIFFSFTFGGETLSLAASDAVLTKLKNEPVIAKTKATGEQLISSFDALCKSYEMEDLIDLKGYPIWTLINVKEYKGVDAFSWKTLLLQELFANDVLTVGTHNMSYAHGEEHISQLMKGYESFFNKVQEFNNGVAIDKLLKANPIQPLFKVR